MDRIYAYRDFEIFNEKNELVIIATSKWVCIDTEKQAIIKVTGELKDAYTMEDRRVFETEIEKIKEPESYIDSCEITITKDLIDINGHVHNLNYMDFANRILPEEVSENAMNVEIMYKKQIKAGEKIKCFYAKEEDAHFVVIKSEDESVLHAIVKL
jgi:medium-chain acyl-[acyl-carrier-protein] hydrolase